MSTLTTTEKLKPSTSDSPLLEATPPKRGRGRPAKYSEDEREEKYKELRLQWNKDHKQECKESSKSLHAE